LTGFLILILVLAWYDNNHFFYAFAANIANPQLRKGPVIHDPSLQAKLVYKGLRSPTTMAFLGPNDILVLERNNGTVQRIIDGKISAEPLLQVSVLKGGERGMLGIATTKAQDVKDKDGKPNTSVFLYFTQSKFMGSHAARNFLYRYDLVDNKLVNPKSLLVLPAEPSRLHNGGIITIGPDNNIYLLIGDVKGPNLQNASIAKLDGRGGILRITQDGKAVGKGIFGNKYPLNLYYAYGIRNGFGMDFDPVTGKLWDTENGATKNDEINLVEPGFNSGWQNIQGMLSGNKSSNRDNLIDFNGTAKYSDPEFTWHNSTGVTALKFLNSDKLGKQYQNDMFVGDINNGNLYHFDLNKKRTELSLNGTLTDKISDRPKELQSIILGTGFNGTESGDIFHGVSDIKVGPDGYLYVLSYGEGAIYKIGPKPITGN
jgi:aldose sugar dehydrogenase